jgi:hypothetical protein
MSLLGVDALKTFIQILLVALGVSGCTSYQLQRNTLAQGRTWTEIQYEMVLDNIAMFRHAPGSLPWHITITQGSSAVTDTVAPTFTHTWPTIAHTFGISGSRNWQDNWTVVPLSDDTKLRALQKIYQKNSGAPWIHDGMGAPGSFGGHFRASYVWVNPSDAEKLADLTFQVLKEGKPPKKAASETVTLPGPIQPLR